MRSIEDCMHDDCRGVGHGYALCDECGALLPDEDRYLFQKCFHHGESREIMSFKGKINVYRCEKCDADTVTIDRDAGTTPYRTGCTKDGCGGIAVSQLYRVSQTLVPTHEWYRCEGGERLLRHPAAAHHHKMGGLFIRPIPENTACKSPPSGVH